MDGCGVEEAGDAAGAEVAGGGEGASAELVGVTWLPLHDEAAWDDEIRSDVYLYPQLRAIRAAIVDVDPQAA